MEPPTRNNVGNNEDGYDVPDATTSRPARGRKNVVARRKNVADMMKQSIYVDDDDGNDG